MDISRAATIKTSRMEVYEPIDALNDAKIDDAHISLMVSVRVMSRITNLKGSAKFLPIDGIEAGSPRFNEAFRDSYISAQVHKPRAIPLELNTLLASRSALDKEINKIVAVVNTLTRHPKLLPKIYSLNKNPRDELAYGIINEALLESPQPGSLEDSQVQHNSFLPSVAGYSPSETSSGVKELHTPWTSDLDSASLSGRSLVFREKVNTSTDLTMHALVPPEVWTDLLPVKNDPTTSLISQMTKTVLAFNVKYKKLQILAAVCGTHDVAVKLWEWVSLGETGDRLVIPVNEISTLKNHDYLGGLTPRTMTNLSFIYKYTDRPIRICSFDHDDQSTETLEITHESESQNATFVHTSRSTCFILGVTCSDKIYSSSEDLRRFVDNADHGTPRDWPYIRFNRETIKDEHLGKDGMTGVVFYTYSIVNGVQSAVSMGTAGCMLVDQRQLATVTKETVNGANDNLLKKDSKEVKPYQITLGKGIEAPAGYSCIFQHGTLKVSPSETPFMQFENGVKFAFRNNGRFEVLDKQDEVFWSSEEAPEGQIPQRLEFCKDGRLRLWNTEEQVYRTPLMKLTRCERKMVFSSEFPYWDIYNSEGEQLWRARGLHLV
ncbi:hypothetical protein FOPG_14856 [Fusarium oxysporum f. sp. conglutinans race 2 54008]|uniref:Bulb-type lectin domain-containing protein n=1 Tax=Fusarium oxysporum f. sp. conglutinans race 2 54008 TaxID=1089457 RepID=X0HB28_FUSOX|nr:hypothetical protein FOPG_14856 [Fusarium oxysporum f. sp. conglutinans race 2 54008]KAG6998506.1 hypothetical protein FocnCong_v013668 [Fusarium oxysporum f. sp. conglutinans]KAI8407882.1 hypothetical protein FOFC_10810 [Fusarium oxysporum]